MKDVKNISKLVEVLSSALISVIETKKEARRKFEEFQNIKVESQLSEKEKPDAKKNLNHNKK